MPDPLPPPYLPSPTVAVGPSPRDPVELRKIVERRFPVYDVQASEHVVAFFVTVTKDSLEAEFRALKDDLKPRGLIPILKFEGGEHSVYVIEKPTRSHRSTRVNVVLFALTVVTTTIAGAWSYLNYARPDPATLTRNEYLLLTFDPAVLAGGFLTFAFPLLLILGVHEMGHYVMARRHGVEASLPFFLPLPPLLLGPPIGTLGAFISMREPIPNRKALLDIGASGPVAGFIVAVPVLLLGMALMASNPVHVRAGPESVSIGTPLIYNLLAMPFGFSEDQLIHPTAFAGWVGLFVTAINLLPAGQLDGGHIAAALFGDRSRYLSYAAVIALLVLGFGLGPLGLPDFGVPGYGGWLVFALLIAFLGLAHPPTLDGVSGLDAGRVAFGALTFGLIILCFTPVPIST